MHTSRVLDQQIGLVPATIARTIEAIDTSRGREDAFRMQRPQLLEALVDVARIQSTEASNAIEEELPDGTKRVRFRTVAAVETPAAMDELHAAFRSARDAGEHHPLLLIGCYVFDFLAIHPFRDGNGRMARLLTLLLLYQSGYDVGRYVSLERLVNDARDGYYSSLQAAGVGWHDDEHTIWPWLEYFLGILLAAYREFENRVGLLGDGRGAKTASIERFVRERLSDEFTIADVREAAPVASDSLIGKVLARLRDEGVIEPLGTGRSARWRRL